MPHSPEVDRPVVLAPQAELGSFRDREGRVFYYRDSVYRGLSETARQNWVALSASRFFEEALHAGRLVATTEVTEPDLRSVFGAEWAAVLRHEAIPYISYPYEWSFGMLKDAARLQLELLAESLESGLILKDSTAFNIQWKGPKPVFIDIPSFERLQPNAPWVGYRQFCQLFLYPLMLQAYKNVPFQSRLRGDIDGIDPVEFSRLMSLGDYLKPGVMTHVILHGKLQSRHADTRASLKSTIADAGFSKAMIQNNVRRLQDLVESLNWRETRSEWVDYAQQHSYADADMKSKETFVREATCRKPRNLVWDLGANTGRFSRIAAESGRYVVAMDIDGLAVEHLYQALRREGVSNILPLVMNMAQASPGLGWQGRERKSLSDRGAPDLALCLALIHHLVISANIRVSEFVGWLAGLNTDLVVEFVTKEDPMVKKLLLNKHDHYDDYEEGYFENCLRQHFHVVRKERLQSGTRILFYAEPLG